MSNSPKYSTASLASDLLSEIATSFQNEMERRRIEREAEAERLRQERIEKATNDTRSDIVRTHADLDALSRSNFANQADVDKLKRAAAEVDRRLNGLTDEQAIYELRRTFGQTLRALQNLVAQTRVADERQAELRKQIEAMGAGPGELRDESSKPFADRLNNLVAAANRAASNSDLDRVEAEWSQLRAEISAFITHRDALAQQLERAAADFSQTQQAWSEFSTMPAAALAPPTAADTFTPQFAEYSTTLATASDATAVADLQRNLTRFSAEVNSTIAAAKALHAKVEHVRDRAGSWPTSEPSCLVRAWCSGSSTPTRCNRRAPNSHRSTPT